MTNANDNDKTLDTMNNTNDDDCTVGIGTTTPPCLSNAETATIGIGTTTLTCLSNAETATMANSDILRRQLSLLILNRNEW